MLRLSVGGKAARVPQAGRRCGENLLQEDSGLRGSHTEAVGVVRAEAPLGLEKLVAAGAKVLGWR
jgi:hypothetical protein